MQDCHRSRPQTPRWESQNSLFFTIYRYQFFIVSDFFNYCFVDMQIVALDSQIKGWNTLVRVWKHSLLCNLSISTSICKEMLPDEFVDFITAAVELNIKPRTTLTRFLKHSLLCNPSTSTFKGKGPFELWFCWPVNRS